MSGTAPSAPHTPHWLPIGSAQIIDWKYLGLAAAGRGATAWVGRVGGESVLLRTWSSENTTYFEFAFLAFEDLAGTVVITTDRSEPARLRLEVNVDVEGRLGYTDALELVEQRKGWPQIDGTIDTSAYNHVIYGDMEALGVELQEYELDSFGVDLVIGNPPYSIDEAAVGLGMQLLSPGGWLALLLPAAFTSSETRYDRFFSQRPYVPVAELALVQRPSFFVSAKGSTTDWKEYSWFIWRKDQAWIMPTLKGQLDWKRQAAVEGLALLPGFAQLEQPGRIHPATEVIEALEWLAGQRRGALATQAA